MNYYNKRGLIFFILLSNASFLINSFFLLFPYASYIEHFYTFQIFLLLLNNNLNDFFFNKFDHLFLEKKREKNKNKNK